MENININTIIESITCPITQQPMKDPVQGNDGQTYERCAIMQALSIKNESPITRQYMTINDLKVNAAIKFLCDKYHNSELRNVDSQSIQDNTDENNEKNYNINVNNDIFKSKNNEYVMMNFNINNDDLPKDLEFGHLSQDIVLVIDKSGSMGLAVEAKDENGLNIENGMSIQDIVNHAAKTVAKTLNKDSRLALVIFDTNITTIFDLMFMTELNKSSALNKIDAIKPGSQTNIWGGIEKASQILENRKDKTRNGVILMLTDGSPNISPARGEVETLKKMKINKNFTTPIYTFGFGYNLKRGLLYDIAKYSNGGNGHIPDGGMIATVFCNFTGNILCTVANNLQIHLNNKDVKIMGDFPMNFDITKEEYVYDIGSVQLEQTRNIVFITNNVDKFTYYYTYKIGDALFKSSKTIEVCIDNINIDDNNVIVQANRFKLVESLRKIINYNTYNQIDNVNEEFLSIEKTLTENSKSDNLSIGMINNLKGDGSNEGQIKLAVTNRQYFNRWGEFYLDQLSRSLNQQIKPNFKDESCIFGGKIFEDCVDKASDIFDSLPPPKPSLMNQSYGNTKANTNINMAAYNNISGGCIDSRCIISMFNGSYKELSNIKKNDIIKSFDENNKVVGAKVLCVIETIITSGKREYVNVNGLSITPWHPIKIGLYGQNEDWFFPGEVFSTYKLNSTSMITLVLEKHHIMFVNGIKCITLGHNFVHHKKLIHPYYGTNKVIENLIANFPDDFENGKISVKDIDIDYTKSNYFTENVIYNSNNLDSPNNSVLTVF